MRPFASAAALLPPVAFRYDPAVVISVFGRYFGDLLSGGGDAAKLSAPFAKVSGATGSAEVELCTVCCMCTAAGQVRCQISDAVVCIMPLSTIHCLLVGNKLLCLQTWTDVA